MPDEKAPAVAVKVAVALVNEYLSGLRGFPLHDAGQQCLGRYISQCALSVAHARSILEQFTDICPTPKEILDVAYNETLRGKFLPPERPLTEKWEAEGFTFDATYYQRMVERNELKLPGNDAPREIDQLYRAVKQKLKLKNFKTISIGQVWSTARELGFPLNHYQREDADTWERIQPKRETRPPEPLAQAAGGETARRITQADIDAARRKRAAESKGAEAGREGE